jgi:muconolactone delta-isomerase
VKVLAICRPLAESDPQTMSTHLAEEAETLKEWRSRGSLVEAYSPGGPGAILVLEAPGVSEAASLVAGLPLCKAGLIQTEVIGLHPLHY